MATPNPSPRNPETPDSGGWFDWLRGGDSLKDEASDLGAEVLQSGIERARREGRDQVPDASLHRERVLGDSERERTSVRGHVIDRFLIDQDVDSERRVLGRGITAANDNITPGLTQATETFGDEAKLEVRIDQLESLEERVKRERLEAGLPVDDGAVRAAVEEELGRFAPPMDDGSPEGLRKRGLKSRAEVLRDNWKRYIEAGGGIRNLWSLVSGSAVDMFAKYGAAAQVVPVWNRGIELNRRAQDIKDQADPYIDATKAGASRAKKGLRGKREAEIEGTAAMLKMKDWVSGFSTSMKSVVFDVTRGRRGKDEIYQQALSHLQDFKRTSPEAFDVYLRSRRANFLQLQKRETVAGLIFRTCDWYIKPQYRTSDTLREDLAEALPIYGTYAAIRDLNDENGLPTWMRYGFVGFNIGLDVLTVASLGALTPVAAAARMAIGVGAKTGARAMVKGGATFSAKNLAASAGAQAAKFSSKEFLASLPRATRKALLSTTSAKLLSGYAAYSGLSHAVDYAFGRYLSEEIIEELAESSVEKALDREFTQQQKRLIRLTSRTAIDLAKESANDDRVEDGVIAEDDERRRGQSENLAA